MLEHIDWVNACPYHRDIPAENVANANFIEAATIKPNSPFITRPAPGIGQNLGGGIEVVVPSGGRQYAMVHGDAMSNFEYYAAAKELVVLLKTAGHADEAAKLQSAMDDGATGTEIFMALRFHLSRIVDAIQLSGAAQTLASRLLAELNKALP